MILILKSIDMMDYVYLFRDVNTSLHSRDELHLIVVHDFPNMFLDKVYIIMLRITASIFIKDIGLKYSFLDVSFPGVGMRVILAS